MKYSPECTKEIRNILETELEKQPISEIGYRIFLINEIEKYKPIVWVNGKIQKRNRIEVPYNAGKFTKGLRKIQLVYWNNWKYNTSISDETRGRLDIMIGLIYKKIGKNYNKINQYYNRTQNS